MRAIKFRGISTHDNYFVYGSLIKKRSGLFYIQDDTGLGSDIETDTIGQFTGMFDKNGKEIYEGDLFKSMANPNLFQVSFINGSFVGFQNGRNKGPIADFNWPIIEVIGNIHQKKHQ